MGNVGNKNLPFVSCLCVTYGRPALLEEAIQCFLNQDYTGKKELVILNDFNQQTFTIDHPEILVVNLPRKVNTLGEKRNMAAGLSKGDVFFPWDDDDICLSFRLSQSVNYLASNEVGYYKPKTAFLWNNGVIDSINANSFHAQCCYTRDVFNKTMYNHMGSGEDQDFDAKVRLLFNRDISSDVAADENFYLYRWAGTNSYHLSALGSEAGETLAAEQLELAAELRVIPLGLIQLEPKWKTNYEQQAKKFIRASKYKKSL